jgi:hypothetical protein
VDVSAHANRFWSWVEKIPDAGCWIWSGKMNPNGYGAMKISGKQYGSHRLAWMLVHGDIPAGMLVCHRCDVRLCCNPSHLFLGTGMDNMRDAVKKGRNYIPQKMRRQKYSPEQLAIAADKSIPVLAVRRMLGMSETHIRRLRP